MSMHFTNVTLDGIYNGIAALIRSKNEWVQRGDVKSNLFTNFEAIEARIIRDEFDYHDISFYFIITDRITGKVSISINEAIKTEDGWKITRNEEIYGQPFLHIYNITESKAIQVANIGYICTKDSGTHDPGKDPKFEYAKLKNLRYMVFNAAAEMTKFQCYGLSMEKFRSGFKLNISGTTASINIWTIGKLMDYNTDVKKEREANKKLQLRCLPFLNGQDKYGTLYIFTTCQESEFNDSYVRTRIDQIEEVLMMFLSDANPDKDARYIPCEFQNKVNLSEEVINYDHDSKNRG